MAASDMIREMCKKRNISIAELCRRIGQTPQNFNKKLQRDTVSFDEMIIIAQALNVQFEHGFVFPNGDRVWRKG